MNNQNTHDLHKLMKRISNEMNDEYNRIQQNALSDPANAGDQGEKNWAKLIKGWIPSNYKVVTRGRIINSKGILSPQVDVLVLKESYPEKLTEINHYISSGVVAAFECKLTLKANHIKETIEKSKIIKELYEPRKGTPYKELHVPIIYGLLAHSHSWNNPGSNPQKNVVTHLKENDFEIIKHPRESIDIICVADLVTCTSYKCPIGFLLATQENRYKMVETGYIIRNGQNSPIGDFISTLCGRLAWENSELVDIRNYYWFSGITGGGNSIGRLWNITDVYTPQTIQDIRSGKLVNTNLLKGLNEWQDVFHFP
ncbi:MAG: hypothetical protein OXI43_09740 [Candidatus Poribacteria bacterium]|nr:hypothetical protein [Candidatus Poribacteria bacterium]